MGDNNMSNFKSEFNKYFDFFGFMCDGPHERVSQNGTLFTAWYILALINYFDEDKDFDLETFDKERSRIVKAYSECVMDDGSTVRFPGCKDLESTDNLIGWGVFGRFMSPMILHRVYNFAEREDWVWPTRHIIPEARERRLLGRMVQVKAHIKMAIDEKINPLESIVWAYSVLSSLFEKHNFDAYALSYLMCVVEKASLRSTFITTTARLIWSLVFRIKYKNGIHDVMQSHWPNHPVIKHLKRFPV